MRYRHSGSAHERDVVVDPYGLASKAGRWYLVADDDGRTHLFALGRLSGVDVLPDVVRHRAGVTLRSAWDDLKGRVETPGDLTVTARVRADRVDLARRILGARLAEVGPESDGWCPIRLRVHEVEGVVQLFQFAHDVEVLEPPAARRHVAELAAALAARHGSS